jgi:GNAT superfamily N-acetyltransferase
MPMPPDATVDFTYRIATLDDIDALQALYNEFFDESGLAYFGLSLDHERGRRWLARAIETSRPVQLLALDGDRPVGVFSYAIDHSVTTEPYASLDKFYVSKDRRRSSIGTVLLSVGLDLAKSDGAVLFRAGISSGLPGADRLFRDAGFVETPHAVTLLRRL